MIIDYGYACYDYEHSLNQYYESCLLPMLIACCLGGCVCFCEYGTVRYSMYSMYRSHGMYTIVQHVQFLLYALHSMYCTVCTVCAVRTVCTGCTGCIQDVKYVRTHVRMYVCM